MILKYTKLKSKNLISFLEPRVTISKQGKTIFKDKNTTILRHLMSTPGTILGNLETIIINSKIVSQSFFPIGGITAISEWKFRKYAKSGQYFDISYIDNGDLAPIDDRETELEKSLKRILDLYTNLGHIYDSKTCVMDIKNARVLLGEIPPDQIDTYKEKWNERRNPEYFNINLKCFGVEKIKPIIFRGLAGLEIELREADVEHIINDLYEIYGPEMLINFIKNG